MYKPFQVGLLSLALVTLIGCGNEEQTAAAPTPPPVAIDVATVLSTEITDWHTFTTRTVAPEQVQLRSRITGIIESINFNEGAYVQKGDTLFVLDQRALQAEVNNLKSQLSRSASAKALAESEYKRATSLGDSKAISIEQVEARKALFDQRSAEYDSLLSSQKIAELNLEFSEIKAPISGQASSAFHTAGNTVLAMNTVLTTIVNTETVEAYFEVDERTWNTKFATLKNVIGLPVRMELTGREEAIFGQINFVDNTINANTGTIRLRAEFNNSMGDLAAGSFARVSIAPNEFSEQLIVPERAIGTDLKNKFILVVNKDNQLTYRPITTGKRLGKFRIVTTGLKIGERFAANGPAKVGPGMPITPREISLELPKSLLVSDFLNHMNNTQSVMGNK